MKIFIVNPACLDKRVTDDDAMTPPMGLYYIASLMVESGFDTKIVNLAPHKSPVEYLIELTEREKPHIIGFSLLNANRHCAIDCAMAVKKMSPTIHIVFGGAAPTFEPHYFFRTCPALDYIVKGEGERTFLELASYLKNRYPDIERLKEIRGLIFRESHHPPSPTDSVLFTTTTATPLTVIIENPPRPQISDLDTLPHPAKYFDFQHLSLSRGCPGRCTFCGSPDFWGIGKVRFHSAKWFVDEMELLNSRGRSHFFISDDTFTMKKSLVIEVCQEILQRFTDRGIKITWAAISRVDFIDKEILFYMRKAGCIQISFGVESGSEEIRRRLGKPFKNETIIRAFRLTASFGILPRGYFIYGSPGETEESIGKSIELMGQIEPLAMVSYMLVIFPGTLLYKNIAESSAPPPHDHLKHEVLDLPEGHMQRLDMADIWDQKIEDIPWFEVDPNLNFEQVKNFGESLRNAFYSEVHNFALAVTLVDNEELYPYHADFLSRLAMTFSHGDYALNPKVQHQQSTAKTLYERALSYAPDSRAYLGLAMLLQKKRDFNGAIAIIKEALNKLSYTNEQPLNSHSHLGRNYSCKKEGSSSRDNIEDTQKLIVKRELTLCMAVSLMNMARFREALAWLKPFSHEDEIKPYIQACQSRL